MKRVIAGLVFLLIVKVSLCQLSGANSFICQLKPGYTEFTNAQILLAISKTDLENFRLLNQRVTLAFDNGFDIILLSAQELKQSGVITDLSTYQGAFPSKYKLPVFHLNEKWQIAVGYTTGHDVKYSGKKR